MLERLRETAEYARAMKDMQISVELDPRGLKVCASKRHGDRLCEIGSLVAYVDVELASINPMILAIDNCVRSIRQATNAGANDGRPGQPSRA